MEISVWREIKAPVEDVFRTITDIEGLPTVDPAVEKIEFVTDQRSGAGTRFRETRVGKGKKVVTELELVEHVENEHARFVSDMGGTVWDTTFRFTPLDSGSRLDIEMEARAHKFLARLLNPLIKPMVRRGMEKHIESVRERCEHGATA